MASENSKKSTENQLFFPADVYYFWILKDAAPNESDHQINKSY